jgi:hypothetical protein
MKNTRPKLGPNKLKEQMSYRERFHAKLKHYNHSKQLLFAKNSAPMLPPSSTQSVMQINHQISKKKMLNRYDKIFILGYHNIGM